MNLTDLDYVKGVVSNMRATFSTPQGEEVMKFLEEAVGFYGTMFDPAHRDLVLINDGKRQIVSTIKSFIKLTPEQIVAMAKTRRVYNG